MKEFDTEGWIYDRSRAAQTLMQLPKSLIETLTTNGIISTVNESGGKALGLQICGLIVSGSDRLSVPRWTPMTAREQMLHDGKSASWLAMQTGRVHVRSSARSEDWIDGGAGRHRSVSCEPEDVYEQAQIVSGWRSTVILQKSVPGIGIVVDIAYSQILDRTVIRISTGREIVSKGGVRTFSSATWDHEGRHELFDAATGAKLMDTRTGTLFETSCLTLPLKEMALDLYKRVKDIGIRFGVQLELVVHPDTPAKWNLVQIRPSPDRVRIGSVQANAHYRALTTTSVVSTAFNIQGMARLVTEADVEVLNLVGAHVESASDHKDRFSDHPILVWEKDPHPDLGFFQVKAAFSAGIDLQVTRRVLMINTTHDSFGKRVIDEQREAVRQICIIAVSDHVHGRIVTALRDGPRIIHAISDGIVGQISLP